MRRMFKSARGAAMVEYVVILVAILVVAAAMFRKLGASTGEHAQHATSVLGAGGPGGGGGPGDPGGSPPEEGGEGVPEVGD